MALFGRRKPGFAKEEFIHPDEIPHEFSDALDPAMHRDDLNPKYKEKQEYAAKAQEVVSGSTKDSPILMAEDRQDLFAYMESLPEMADPFPPFPEEEVLEEEPPQSSPEQILAAYITARTQAAVLTPKKLLEKEVENVDEMIAAMEADEKNASISKIQGKADLYYYDCAFMTDNYAMIAALVADKDIPQTIAKMVRWNCETYPSPTPLDYFSRHPYYLTLPQLNLALQQIEKREDYADIKQFVSGKGMVYLYSDAVMSARYAKSLADFAEESERA